MTIRDVVSRLRHDIREHSQDSVFYNRHLWNAFWTSSKRLIQIESDENKLKDQNNLFKSFHLDTEEVNIYIGSCVPLECIACRAKMPLLLSSKNGVIYNFIGSPDQGLRYSLVTPFEYSVKSKIKGTSAKYAFIEDGYIYLSKCIPCIKIVGIPDEFSDTQTKGQCSILDNSISLPDYLIEAAIRMSKENIINKPYDHVPNKNTLS